MFTSLRWLLTVALLCATRPVDATPASRPAPRSSATKSSAPPSAPTSSSAPADAAPSGLYLPDFAHRTDGEMGRAQLWRPEWPRFGLGEWILSGVAGATAVTFTILGPLTTPRDGGIGPDEDIRSALRASTLERRFRARDVSDVLLTTITTYPLVDALLVAGWYRRSPGVALQMALIDMEVLALTTGVAGIFKSLVSRRRPYGRICGSERPWSTRDCDSNDLDYSFFSGHAAISFASASVNCAHHIWLGLYGSTGGDATSCAAGFAVAATTSVLRIVGDQHYFSDVMVGAAVGTLIGFGVPWLFHYRHGSRLRSKVSQRQDDFSLQLAPHGLGLGALGTF